MHCNLNIVNSAVIFALLLMPVTQVRAQTAEDASAACTEAAGLINEGDFVGALDEAEWCVESLRQLKQQRTLTVFPDAVDGFEGGEIDNQSAMGMTIIEREYTADNRSVSVSLTGGVAGGGLAALAQFASGMGAGAGGKKMRVQKRTVIDMGGDGGQAEYMVQLKSGGMLMITSNDLDSDALLDFVKAFPIAELDEAITP
ncbi:MAG: hypothetical protein AB8B87_12555 [Granulosicoccus sp.]